MATFQINPNISNVDYSVVVPAYELELLGWDFDTNTDDVYIRLTFETSGIDGKIKCFWAFVIDGADREDSGDDEKSLEDLITLLEKGVIKYNSNHDYSTKSNQFVDWIIKS